MSTPKSPPLLFEALSIELLEYIFLFTSPQDILRLSLVTNILGSDPTRLLTERLPKVNRACNKLVQASPSIQYEIDLFAVGLRRDPRFEGSIADCRVALEAYRTRWETLDPVEKWSKTLRGGHDKFPDVITVDDVHGLRWEGRVEFFAFGSGSRGREWDIPLKGFEDSAFSFYPQANVLAIAGNETEDAPLE